MNQKFSRWMTVAALAIAGAMPLLSLPVRAQEPAAVAPADLTEVDQLKTQAFAALRIGNFDTGNDLLGQAAKRSADPQLAQMHAWTSQFDDQFKVCTEERHKAYDKAVADVQKLLANGKDDAALDDANAAQSLSDDKKAFHDLPWVKSLIADGVKRAAGYEATDQWYRAMRLYSDLAAVEPASKDWKEKFKAVSRRWRLLATYASDSSVKAVIADELRERDEVDALLNPTTQPTSKPSEPVARNENFKVDWHDSLKGIKLGMLVNAMHDAFTEYYRDVTYRGLMNGGLTGVDAVINTHGLEKTFPGLADAAKKAEFQKDLDSWKSQVAAATAENEEDLISEMLSEDKDGLLAQNDRTVQLPREVVISEFAEAALATLDPFSNMIWPGDVPEFTKATQGEFSGIGVQILPEQNGDLRVVRPLPDSPAERAGIRAADIISEINGKSAKHITSDEAVKNITGPSGTTVNLTVRSPDGTTKTLNVRREKIKVESVEGYTRLGGSKWNYYIDPINKIAYLRITSFSGFTVKELHAAIDSMGDDVNGIIIDLRANPGGLLQAAIGVCDEFLKEGTIVSTHPDRETRNGPTLAVAKDDHNEFTKPLVVLINQYSASASEIVSGALKDDHRAILVGERSFGKGSVQQIFSLEGGDAILKLTTAHYYLPSGRCIHREENSTEWGVDPDVTVVMTPEQMQNAQLARQATEMGPQPATMPTTPPSEVINTTTTGPANHDTFAIKNSATQPTTQLAGATTKPAPKTLLEADPQLAAGLLVIRLELTGAHL
jgi:carboxyl-terminal processing protease